MKAKTITQWYLKWYYGYKNFGDEVLLIGVLQYIFAHYPLEKLYIEVDNEWRTRQWLSRHEAYIPDLLCKLELVPKRNKRHVFLYAFFRPRIHKFLWWGEIFTPARWRFHGWRNMFFLYFLSFWTGNVTLLGWISRPTSRSYRLLYRLTIPSCASCILREQTSYEYACVYRKKQGNTILYHDFAYDVVNSPYVSILAKNDLVSKTWLVCPYILCNTMPHIDMTLLTQKLTRLTETYSCPHVVYMAWWKEDALMYRHIEKTYPDIHIHYFDWTLYDISTIISVYMYATAWLVVRLHLLAMLCRCQKPYDCIVYQEKITKFLGECKNKERYQSLHCLKK